LPHDVDHGAVRVRAILDHAPEMTARPPRQPEPLAWPVMAEEAYCGLAGDIVNTIKPQSEADPVALLIQTLASVGNAMGRGAYYQVEGDRHGSNLYAVLVGETAKGRKGTSSGRVRQIMQAADPQWVSDRMHSGGLSSGEGLIWAVRDPITQSKSCSSCCTDRSTTGKNSRRNRQVYRTALCRSGEQVHSYCHVEQITEPKLSKILERSVVSGIDYPLRLQRATALDLSLPGRQRELAWRFIRTIAAAMRRPRQTDLAS
jgi:hypothetical protein